MNEYNSAISPNFTKNYPSDAYLPEGQRLATQRNKEATSSLAAMERAMSMGSILEGMVLYCDTALTLHIDLPQIPSAVALMPREEVVYALDGQPVKDIAILTRVGKAVCFKVIGIEWREGVPYITLSRRAAQAECAANYLSTLIPGDILPARVTHMEGFGAFVDIGCGLPSLLSIDTISVSRISHPSDRLHNGQYIWAVVRAKVESADGLTRRIFVSTRELLGTWEENAAAYQVGQTVVGILRSVEEYGVFVELAPNLTGLAELKEGMDNAQAEQQKKRLMGMIGKPIAVFIKSIQPDRMKVKLVLIDSYVDASEGGCVAAARAEHNTERGRSTQMARPLTYFIDGEKTKHIGRWLYSPVYAAKRVESIFDSDVSSQS